MSEMRLGCSKLTNSIYVGKMTQKTINGRNILISHAKKHDVTNDFWCAVVQMLGDPDEHQIWTTVIGTNDDTEYEYEMTITKRKKQEKK